jgi:hypothetical protein
MFRRHMSTLSSRQTLTIKAACDSETSAALPISTRRNNIRTEHKYVLLVSMYLTTIIVVEIDIRCEGDYEIVYVMQGSMTTRQKRVLFSGPRFEPRNSRIRRRSAQRLRLFVASLNPSKEVPQK